MRRILELVLMLAFVPWPAAAQSTVEPRAVSWRGGPIDRCRTMILTDFGAYLVSGTPGGGGLNVRAVADYGVLVNLDARSAIGGTLFASLSRNSEFVLGPAVRYRRWLGRSQSIDVALGTPLIGSAPAPYGLIKYNLTPWVGLAVRPELRRETVVNVCDGFSCTDAKRTRFVVAAGVEVGWIPGLALTVTSGVVGLVAVAAIVASGS